MLTFREFKTPQPYEPIYEQMRAFTKARTSETPDEIWLLEHPPVFTQGQAGKPEHLLTPSDIPVVQSDRGGQITYHGPGQLMIYPLLNLKRYDLSARKCVKVFESMLIKLLSIYDIPTYTKDDAPGVYCPKGKISSIGLRIRKGYSYHGMALNVCMDLTPFQNINPCGFKNLPMTQIQDFVPNITIQDTIETLKPIITNTLHILWACGGGNL